MIVAIKQLYNNDNEATKVVTIQGWVKSNRNGNKVGFLDINDGSTLKTLQVVYNVENPAWKQLIEVTTGSAISVTGEIVLTDKAQQPFELKLQSLDFLNLADKNYPIQKKAHSHEFLREQAHLRSRTDTFLAIFKVRNQIAFAIHQFLQNSDFIYLNSPIITANDAEGAGENFIVTTITSDQYEKDFFGKKAALTVSGQLNAEAYAQAFKKVYTFGPTFRAENSNTTRHAAEFWMIEPEVAFADLESTIKLAKDLVISVVSNVLENCPAEVDFFNQRLKSTEQSQDNLMKRLAMLTKAESYKVLTYTEVIEILLKAKEQGKEFIFNDIKWGMDLQSEHERYLCEEVSKGPVFVTNYPQDIKAFYMKANPISQDTPERRTVAAMDLLVPGIGELIGGSVREDDYDKLIANKKQFKIENNDLQWYFDLRKSGFAPSAGFGLGLERLIMLITGINNIRDVIPFPRTPNNLTF
ncbi:Asparagine--tRNA ligase [Spiroplasma platyhelix PALS-1]|nr:asparagine--tRNA ligase [Spiroplasma platyhelix]MBE4703786.1 Asparagine--tRNA ligase [Spiroplasma platyhelix PALS-1]UJB29044.1 asparaginyl-tRNA synthetase [Spiroplasma platyhelix PALS-1]